MTKAKATPKKNVGWVLNLIEWQYNDEYYYRDGKGGVPLQVFTDRKKAEKALLAAEKNSFLDWFGTNGSMGLGEFMEDLPFSVTQHRALEVLESVGAKGLPNENDDSYDAWFNVTFPMSLTDAQFQKVKEILNPSVQFYTLTEIPVE